MMCPHCRVEIHHSFSKTELHNGNPIGKEDGELTWWSTAQMMCPACSRPILRINARNEKNEHLFGWQVHPRFESRPSPAPAVPDDLKEDYVEAAQVLSISPKASAALSRRCLQELLRKQGYTQKDLAPAIQAALDSKTLPIALADNLDAVRNIGNFAAHVLKDTQSGLIVPVEPHEAEWNLDVLDSLFEFYYAQPARDAARRAALNAKLQAAGKPLMKTS